MLLDNLQRFSQVWGVWGELSKLNQQAFLKVLAANTWGVKLLDEVKAACQTSERTVLPLKEAVASLVAELDTRRTALIEDQLTSQLEAPTLNAHPS